MLNDALSTRTDDAENRIATRRVELSGGFAGARKEFLAHTTTPGWLTLRGRTAKISVGIDAWNSSSLLLTL